MEALTRTEEPIHVDDFINTPVIFAGNDKKAERFAKWFLAFHRMPAHMKISFREFFGDQKLFCIYGGKVFRVTGASRMGDVYLTANLSQEEGYQMRILINGIEKWLTYEDYKEMLDK